MLAECLCIQINFVKKIYKSASFTNMRFKLDIRDYL